MLSVTLHSALEKIFLGRRIMAPPYSTMSCLGGEEFALQAVIHQDGWGTAPLHIAVESPLEGLRVFQVGHVPCALTA